MTNRQTDNFLSPYRVLDLSDERGILCGKILADLGADVVQIEPPGGSSARLQGPFYKNEPGPENSLFWWAYGAGKRGVTLDIAKPKGAELLKRLVKDAHFLIESYAPGFMESVGLGYAGLEALNPGLVMVSITSFGQKGPYGNYKGSDIVGMALGGFMHLTGDQDRPPLRISHPQFYLHGASAGALGAMLAHTHRAATGEGQHVDVSCQQAAAKTLAHAPQFWDAQGVVLRRMGPYRPTAGDSMVRVNWRCKNGFINFMPQGGGPGVSASTRAMLAWMREDGMGSDSLDAVKWEQMHYSDVPGDVMRQGVVDFGRFIETKTKDELIRESKNRRIILFPLNTHADILEYPQLSERDYFVNLPHPELGTSVKYPGRFILDGVMDRVGPRSRAPLLGEHNGEVYGGELGMPDDEIESLKENGTI